MPFGKFQVKKVNDYSDSVRELAGLVQRGQIHPKVVETARRIVNGCPARDDMCELQAIWTAVRYGTDQIQGLEKGVRYTSDPDGMDMFVGTDALLGFCERGGCGGDCDDTAVMIATLAAAVGHVVGLRIWKNQKTGPYEHIYAVALRDKHWGLAQAKDEANVVSMDASTENQPGFNLEFDEAPTFGYVKTTWLMKRKDD